MFRRRASAERKGIVLRIARGKQTDEESEREREREREREQRPGRREIEWE